MWAKRAAHGPSQIYPILPGETEERRRVGITKVNWRDE